jgi:hypothetical protein
LVEVARILALFSAVLLAGAVAMWAKRLRGPLLQRLDGRIASNGRPAAIAMQLLLVAVGGSAVAAVLAVAGWIFG